MRIRFYSLFCRVKMFPMFYKDRLFYLSPAFAIHCCLSLLLLLLLVPAAYAQKYNFINLNVENGLAQSQVTVFSQNRNNELLIGTFGGLSIFDGTNFINYNKSKGLSQNLINALSCDARHNVWIGTNSGLSRFDGKQFKTFYPSEKSDENVIRQIETDGYGNVWALTKKGKLYRFNGNAFRAEKDIDSVSAVTLDKSGNLWAAVYLKGIYIFKEKEWQEEIKVDHDPSLFLTKLTFGKYSGTLYCYGSHGLLAVDKGKFKAPEWTQAMAGKGFLINMLEDSKGNIWLSLDDGGAWVLSQQNWTHYTYQNGLTDDNVTSFYEDAEGNIWIGSNGSGIFRYTGSIFTYYDRTSGLPGPSVMSIAQNRKGDIFLASNSSGLYQLKKGIPGKVNMPGYNSGINSLLTDSSGRLWVGTDHSGLWYFDGNTAKSFAPSIEKGLFGINNLYRQGNVLWIASATGLYRLQGDNLSRENALPNSVYSLGAINADSLLIGTIRGAYIYRTDQHRLIADPFVANSTTLCFESDARRVYVGTDDKGVLIWDRITKQWTTINQKSGLTCDYIYSLLRDRNGNIWVGTGCGIDKITFTEKSYRIRSFGKSDGLLGVENNANASFEDHEGYLWFGTTKGVFRYNPYVTFAPQQAPKMVLQSVKLFSKDMPEHKYSDSTIAATGLQWDPVLPPGQNHLTFSFKGIYLSNPEKIKYRYQLVGIDKNFTETDQTTVVYPNLPPGQYLFKVWASDAEGNWYNNAVSYPFTINAPYYTTWYFRLGLGLLLIGLFMGGVYFRNRQKELRRQWEERLREKEQAMVRQKTAEDFHDEIGNKLTRINLLATIAEGKLQQPAADVQPILHQIQQNVTSLYNGAKDIIWSLQPDSDYLDEIIFRIRQNTADLVQDTGIRFEYEQSENIATHIKLPIDYSRNLIMIFKEAVNNTVKHAQATQITLSAKEGEEGSIVLTLQDDGRGFDLQTTGKGNGLANMSSRANRIGVRLDFKSRPGAGTTLQLYIDLAKVQ